MSECVQCAYMCVRVSVSLARSGSGIYVCVCTCVYVSMYEGTEWGTSAYLKEAVDTPRLERVGPVAVPS
jgi:hypothetical protein